MAYLAVNMDGTEVRFDGKIAPFKFSNGKWYQLSDKPSDKTENIDGRGICLAYEGKTQPFGTIIAMTGQKLTWNDEPIKI